MDVDLDAGREEGRDDGPALGAWKEVQHWVNNRVSGGGDARYGGSDHRCDEKIQPLAVWVVVGAETADLLQLFFR